MTLLNLMDCISMNQDIEIFVSDPESGYISGRCYFGRKYGVSKQNRDILKLEVDSIEIHFYSNMDPTLKITCLSNHW